MMSPWHGLVTSWIPLGRPLVIMGGQKMTFWMMFGLLFDLMFDDFSETYFLLIKTLIFFESVVLLQREHHF